MVPGFVHFGDGDRGVNNCDSVRIRCLLLRARRKRPRCRRAAEQRDELAASFDHLVGAGKQHRRNFQPECFGGLEVYDEIELGWLLNW